MKALLSRAPGGPETLVLADVPEPPVPPGRIRLAVRAIGVNYPDVLIIEDKYQFKPERPFSPGAEASGIVDAVGEGVAGFAVGDRILATCGWGAMAEKVIVEPAKSARLPDAMPFDEAGRLRADLRDLLPRADGPRPSRAPARRCSCSAQPAGWGSPRFELGKALGARVVAGVSSLDKLDLARQHGADDGFVYPPGPFDADGRKALAGMFKEACGRGGADVIYDPVGGDYAEPALRAVAWKGRYLVVGFPAGIPRIPLNLTLLKGCDIVGVFWGAAVERNPERHRESLAELFALYGEGRIRPEVSERFPLARAGEAIATLASRRLRAARSS